MSELKRAKSRLGRGLSSLLSVSEIPVEVAVQETAPAAPTVQEASSPVPTTSPLEIPIAQITPNPHQPRRQFHEASLSELAASVKSNGLIQPIVVRRTGDGYQLVAGERRWRAAKMAGLESIPAIVREVDSFTQAQLALIENIHREDLNPMERAAAYKALIDQLGLTQAELASRLGEDRSTVTNFVRLLELAEPVKGHIRDGRLSMGHAKVLAGVADVLEQERLASLAVSQDLSVRNLERLTQATAIPTPPKQGKAAPSPHMQELEKSFARQLGLRVQIRAGSNKSKGRIIIHYASLDQFDALQERLGISSEQD